MTFTKETWLGMAGIATLLAYFFWPKKASASTVSTSKPVAKTTTSTWTAPKAKPSGTAPAPTGGTTTVEPELPPYGTPSDSDSTTERPATEPAKGMGDSGFGDSGMSDRPSIVLTTGVGAVPFHGIPRTWWTMLPKATGADFGMWSPPAKGGASRTGRANVGAGPHIFQGKDYNPTSVWPAPPPMFAQIPGFSDYDLGFDYGKASCLGLAALMMRPTAPSDDWLTGYDAGCAAAHARTH